MLYTEKHNENRYMQPVAATGAASAPDIDNDLMRRIGAGDQAAFRALMSRHLQKTVRLAARMLGSDGLADDVAQEAFVRVWKHAARWQESEVKGARFTTWLYRIVLNIVIDEKRKRSFTAIDDIPEPVDSRPDAQGEVERREKAARVHAALQQLPERQRAAFILCFYEEYSNREAAEMLDISVKALESLLVRSRRTLRDLLLEDKP